MDITFLPQELWERTPPEALAYIRALEARVTSLEAPAQQLRERLGQDSRTSNEQSPVAGEGMDGA